MSMTAAELYELQESADAAERLASDIFEDVSRAITGTVKKHEDSEKYGKSTVLTRCKLVAA